MKYGCVNRPAGNDKRPRKRPTPRKARRAPIFPLSGNRQATQPGSNPGELPSINPSTEKMPSFADSIDFGVRTVRVPQFQTLDRALGGASDRLGIVHARQPVRTPFQAPRPSPPTPPLRPAPTPSPSPKARPQGRQSLNPPPSPESPEGLIHKPSTLFPPTVARRKPSFPGAHAHPRISLHRCSPGSPRQRISIAYLHIY